MCSGCSRCSVGAGLESLDWDETPTGSEVSVPSGISSSPVWGVRGEGLGSLRGHGRPPPDTREQESICGSVRVGLSALTMTALQHWLYSAGALNKLIELHTQARTHARTHTRTHTHRNWHKDVNEHIYNNTQTQTSSASAHIHHTTPSKYRHVHRAHAQTKLVTQTHKYTHTKHPPLCGHALPAILLCMHRVTHTHTSSRGSPWLQWFRTSELGELQNPAWPVQPPRCSLCLK